MFKPTVNSNCMCMEMCMAMAMDVCFDTLFSIDSPTGGRN